MASSKVMPSSSSTSTSTISDLSKHPLTFHHRHHRHHPYLNHNPNPNYTLNNPSQMIPNLTNSALNDSMFRTHNGTGNDGSNSALLDADITLADAAGAISAAECSGGEHASRKTVDEVWREIVAEKNSSSNSGCGGGERTECKVEGPDELMTLEDFLARATAKEEDDDGEVKATAFDDIKLEVLPQQMVGVGGGSGGMYGLNQGMAQAAQFHPQAIALGVGFRNGVGGGVEAVVGGRAKRRGGMMMEPLNKAAQQRQRRMINNRESAARSRERKQAYQVELESLAIKLEEENEELLREKAEWKKERYKQLMEKLFPVLEKRRAPRKLRKVNSM